MGEVTVRIWCSDADADFFREMVPSSDRTLKVSVERLPGGDELRSPVGPQELAAAGSVLVEVVGLAAEALAIDLLAHAIWDEILVPLLRRRRKEAMHSTRHDLFVSLVLPPGSRWNLHEENDSRALEALITAIDLARTAVRGSTWDWDTTTGKWLRR